MDGLHKPQDVVETVQNACIALVPYRRKFSLDKNFAKPRYLCILQKYSME